VGDAGGTVNGIQTGGFVYGLATRILDWIFDYPVLFFIFKSGPERNPSFFAVRIHAAYMCR
jgi:hypothetical protein